MSMQLLTELLFPLLLMLASFGAGLLLGWHFTGHYYRKLVAALIEQHCAVTAHMRQEIEEAARQGQTSTTSAA